MAQPRTDSAGRPTPDDAPLHAVADEDLIARVTAARQSGDEDAPGVEELLRRAADGNKAALDRLAQ